MSTIPVGTPIAVASPLTPIYPTAIDKPVDKPSLMKRSSSNTINYLLERGWPPGLTNSFAASIDAFPVRYIIVDNSGSMQMNDGSRLVSTSNGLRTVSSTRWDELGDVVEELGTAVTRLHAETHFHLLNPCRVGQFFKLEGDSSSISPNADLATLKRAMKMPPTGTTPLTEAVQRVTQAIAPSAEAFNAKGQKAVVVLATDGLPNDPSSFLRALQELQRLPVWLVVRLCTDQDDVVEYWSDLDKSLERPLETLDDVQGEAKEVYALNRWLTYAPALHLARTAGMHEKLFDLIEEVPLQPFQCKLLIEQILGCEPLPVPEVDPELFFASVSQALEALPAVYNPITGRMAPWIDEAALRKHMRRHGGLKIAGGDSSFCACM